MGISCSRLRFRRGLPAIQHGTARLPRRLRLLAMTNLVVSAVGGVHRNLQLPMALNPRKGDAASVRRQSRQRLRSERRYRRNRRVPF